MRDYHGAAAIFGKNLNAWKGDYFERIGVSFEFPNHYLKLIDAPHGLKLKYGKRQVRVEYETNGQTEYREFDMYGLGENADFLTILCDNHVRMIHTLEATLEDIFIQVTGRSLV